LFGCFPGLAQFPINLALKVVFGELLRVGPYPSCVKIFLAQYAYMMTGAVCFEQKLLFVVRNLGI